MTLDIGGVYEYRRAVGSNSAAFPLWQQPWWLDACTDSEWDAVTLIKAGRVVAALPYVRRRIGGVRVWTQPPLTQSLGPWLEPSAAKYVKRLSQEHALLAKLAEQVPRNVYYRQNWAIARSDWLPFHWRGYEQTTRYTYRLDLQTSEDRLWAEMSDDTRNVVRKARRRFGVSIEQTGNLDDFQRLNVQVFSRQGVARP